MRGTSPNTDQPRIPARSTLTVACVYIVYLVLPYIYILPVFAQQSFYPRTDRIAGELEPIAWSKGFVASARLLAREFVTSRSLTPLNGVILGPPGGNQSTVCHQASISLTNGQMRAATEVALFLLLSFLFIFLTDGAP